jgi:uncharacterized MAPEG superfamily protein
MGIELRMLAWTIVLGIVQLLIAANGATAQRGMKWNASARDGTFPPLQGVPARLERAFHNFLESFPFFAVAVLGVVAMQRAGEWSALAVQLYFWARVVYVPLYASGVPYVRSLVWVASMSGIAILVFLMLI